MDKRIKIFEKDTKDFKEVLYMGRECELLRNNAVFTTVIEDMYWTLTSAEDKIMSELHADSRELNNKVRQLSMLRRNLTDFVLTLDSFIDEAENTKEQQQEQADIAEMLK